MELNGSQPQALKMCPFTSCTVMVGNGQLFLDHIKQHISDFNYKPQGPTLIRFGCKRCPTCKQMTDEAHSCVVQRSSGKEYPSKDRFNTCIDVSWTVSARGERDIFPVTFEAVKDIIESYFDVGIASTERGAKNNHLHIQCTGKLYYHTDEGKVKRLGGL